MLSFKGFRLRTLTVDDVGPTYLSWVKDPEVTEYLALKHEEHTLNTLTEFVNSCRPELGRYLFAVISPDGNHIGNFSIYNISKYNQTFDFGYFIGEKEWWGREAGLACCLLGLSFAFEDLKLRKTFTYVESSNIKSRFVLQKIGFEKEAILKERVLNRGVFVDSVVYGLSVSQWEGIVKQKFLTK